MKRLEVVLVPAALGLASSALAWLAPSLPVPAALADLCATAWGVVVVLVAMFLCRPAQDRDFLPLAGGMTLAVLAGAAALLVVVDRVGLDRFTLALQVTALLAIGRALGSAVGERIASPGHVLPASVVAAAADVASVLSPEGPTHSIAASERALSVFALAVPVPGTNALSLLLGVGDLVFLALLVGVMRRHRLKTLRTLVGATLGLLLAFAASALLGLAVPALVTIGLCANLTEPAFRTLPPRERRTAFFGMAVAVVLVLAVVVRSRL